MSGTRLSIIMPVLDEAAPALQIGSFVDHVRLSIMASSSALEAAPDLRPVPP